MTYKKVAIIGANGFVGTNLAKFISGQYPIQLVLTGTGPFNLSGVDADYRQLDLVHFSKDEVSIFSDVDLIYYLASVSIPSSTWDKPEIEVEQNLLPFIRFMNVVTETNIKKIVFISSAGTVYGPTNSYANEDSYKNPFNPHGIIKLTMEYFLNYYQRKFGLSFDIYRVANVYGEGQRTQKGIGIINTFLESIIRKGTVNIFGDGSNVRNYLYVQDLAHIMSQSLVLSGTSSHVLNVTSNDTLSINELVSLMSTVVPLPFQIVNTPSRLSDNPAILLDHSRLLETFPNLTFTPIREGIKRTFEFIRSQING